MVYEEEEDILTFSKGRKVKSSIDIDDFVIDIDHNGFVSGIEILNASDNLNISEKKLKSLTQATMTVTYKPDCVIICLVMIIEGEKKDITIPLTIDLGHKSISKESLEFAIA